MYICEPPWQCCASEAALWLQVARLEGFAAARMEDVCTVHSQQYVLALQRQLKSRSGLSQLDADTYATPSTFDDSMRARPSHMGRLQWHSFHHGLMLGHNMGVSLAYMQLSYHESFTRKQTPQCKAL